MHRDGCSCRNALLPSHLRSESEEVNVASGVVAMGRSGVAGRSVCAGRMPTLRCAQNFHSCSASFYGRPTARGSDAITRNSVPAGISFASFVSFCSKSLLFASFCELACLVVAASPRCDLLCRSLRSICIAILGGRRLGPPRDL